jgi:hypothetical protein
MKAKERRSVSTASPRHAPVGSDVSERRSWSKPERHALNMVGDRDINGFSSRMIDQLVAVSSLPEWRCHLAERYLETHPVDDRSSLRQRTSFADTVAAFGPVAHAGVERCLPWIETDPQAIDPGDGPDGTGLLLRSASIRAALASGDRHQVRIAVPVFCDAINPYGSHPALEGAELAGHLQRFRGSDRRAVITALHEQIPDEIAQGLTARQAAIGRALMLLGDDHPTAHAWVRAQAVGCEPPRRDQTFLPPHRLNEVMGWCDAALTRGPIDQVTTDAVMPLLMQAMAEREPSLSARAGGIIGRLAARTP